MLLAGWRQNITFHSRGFQLGINLSADCSCTAQATWPDGEKVLSYLKDVDHLGLTGEIRFDSEGFRTDIQLDLIEVRFSNLDIDIHHSHNIWKRILLTPYPTVY